MDILSVEILKHPVLRSQIAASELTNGVLLLLFGIDSSGAKLKDEASRKRALHLLEIISENYPKESAVIKRYLYEIHEDGNWRTSKKTDWNINSGLNRHSSFVGLQNLGATCYMNSSLQQLFMIPQLRKEIIEVKHKNFGQDTSILYQLQLVFTSLLASQRTVYNPLSFAKNLKIDGRPFSPYEQKDVDEFLVYLFDRLEQELKGTAQEKLLKNLFKLTFANEIICKDCTHRSETHEESLSLILNVKNKKSIYESLNGYIQSDMLEGDNAYFCERCDMKVSAQKRQNIKTLPNMLVMVLKRFEFNYATMTKVKVNDYCEFPQELDLEEFTQEGQTVSELNKDLASGKIIYDDLSEDQRKLLKRKIPKYYYKYKLQGIIVHSGYADAGHYYSYILNKENETDSRWLEFNDSMVRNFDFKNIPEETFGGEEEIDSTVDSKETHREKIRNAYVLIYERMVKLNPDALEEYKLEEREIDINEVESVFDNMIIPEKKSTIAIPEMLQNTIKQDNKNFWIIQYIFNSHYLEFVSNLICKTKIVGDKNYERARDNHKLFSETEMDIAYFAVHFLLTTGLHAENKDEILRILEFMKNYCAKNVRVSLWICKLFCYQNIIQEIFINCPYKSVTRWVTLLLYYAMKRLYNAEKKSLLQIVETPANVMFAKGLCSKVNLPESTIKGNRIQLADQPHTIPYSLLLIDAFVQRIVILDEAVYGPFFKALCYFARLGPEIRKFLNQCSMLGVCFELLFCAKGKCCHLADQFIAHIELQGLMLVSKVEQCATTLKSAASEEINGRECMFELIHRLITSAEISMLKKAAAGEDKAMNSKFNASEENHFKSLKEEKKLEILLADCIDSKVALNYLSKILAYVCQDNEEFTNALLTYIVNKIHTINPYHLKLFFRASFVILSNNDSIANKYILFIKGYYTAFCKVINSPRSVECFIDFLIKLCRENNEFLNTLRNDKEGLLLDLVIKWLNDNSSINHLLGVRFHAYHRMRLRS